MNNKTKTMISERRGEDGEKGLRLRGRTLNNKVERQQVTLAVYCLTFTVCEQREIHLELRI